MRWSEAADQYCSIARTLGVLGDRWTLLIIREAFSGVRRFDDFRDHLEIARNVLTDRLGRLVDAGVLQKSAYQEKPPRFEYRLTEAGLALYPVLVSLMAWGDRYRATPAGPPLELVHTECGRTVVPELRCPACEGTMTARNSRLVAGPGLPARLARERETEIERLRAQRQPSGTGPRGGSPRRIIR